jgi:exo-beta-1,3-glucanase (GH17 family)
MSNHKTAVKNKVPMGLKIAFGFGMLANKYPHIICCLSAGNVACVDWTDHYVPVERVINYVKMIKKGAKQPVTFCENYLPWLDKLKDLVEVVDFISIHTYPVCEYKNLPEAMEYTKHNYYSVAERFDEPWKGSDGVLEPEKHWGLFKVDLTPKLVISSKTIG